MMLNSAIRLLDEVFRKYPDKMAVEDERGALSYRRLREEAMAVGTKLLMRKAEDDDISPVLIYLPKSTDCIVSFFGALYSGNPYVPVDIEMPTQRLCKIITNLCPGHIITDRNLAGKLIDIPESVTVLIYDEIIKTSIDTDKIDNAVAGVIDTDPIYIMYTSGSTGEPKGVTVSHRGVIDYAQWVCETFNYDQNTVMANQAAFYFDNSVFDIYGCIYCGGKMLIIPQNLILYPSKLPQYLEENQVTSIFWVPTVMINVANSGALSKYKLQKLKTVAFCGEVMPNLQLNIWRRQHPDCVYANLYGPTEITDVCTYYIADREFSDTAALPIGRACENTRVIILDDKNQVAKKGQQGELCVIGSGVSLGYWNAPELSEKVFVQNPVNKKYNQRIYRTGDLAYVDDDGMIIFLGRKDSQIKLRGNRIELGEVETAAVCVEGINNACALFDDKNQEIVLFLETENEYNLRKFNLQMRKYVPAYMLAGKIITMERLPHTPNEKIDRVTLRKTYLSEQ